MTFASWLEKKYIEWMSQEGKRKTLSAFGEYLDISQSQLTRYMAGQINPSDENILKIATRLGPEVYFVLGLIRPDAPAALKFIIRNWDKIPEEGQRKILEEVEKHYEGDTKISNGLTSPLNNKTS